jgi:type III pantothenate kinase
MNLVIDNGNTALKIGVFDGDSLLFQEVYSKQDTSNLLTDLAKYQFRKVLVSKVSPLPSTLESLLEKHPNVIQLNPSTLLPITNCYKTPETLGNDRLANAIAANMLFPNKNCLIIDVGTCIKYDFISNSSYLGGAISPGLMMRYKSLNYYTSQLPLLNPIDNPDLLGIDTHNSIHSGVINGMKSEILGFMGQYLEKYSSIQFILTGGDCRYFLNLSKTSIFVDPFLNLKGLNTILQFNK